MIEEGEVVVLQSGEKTIVENINKVVYDESITVYTFEVEDFHIYLISDINVLVHNRCDEIYNQGYSYQEILEEAKNMFGK